MLDLNTVAIEQQGTDARLLEEPLPFVEEAGQDGEDAASQSAEQEEQLVEEAEFTGPEPVDSESTSVEVHPGKVAPELSFDFDPNEDNGEEDLLK